MWKKIKGSRPMSQRAITENLMNALKEVKDTFPRIKLKAATPIPQPGGLLQAQKEIQVYRKGRSFCLNL
jgi:hypothetical protein